MKVQIMCQLPHPPPRNVKKKTKNTKQQQQKSQREREINSMPFAFESLQISSVRTDSTIPLNWICKNLIVRKDYKGFLKTDFYSILAMIFPTSERLETLFFFFLETFF